MEFPFEHIEKFIFETIFVIFHNIRWLFCLNLKKNRKEKMMMMYALLLFHIYGFYAWPRLV